jgi:hypothetical protein
MPHVATTAPTTPVRQMPHVATTAPTTPARQMPQVATTAPTTPAQQPPQVATPRAAIPYAHYPPALSTIAAIRRTNASPANSLPSVPPLTVAAPQFIQVAPRTDTPAMNTRSRRPLLAAPTSTASSPLEPHPTHDDNANDVPDVDMIGPPATSTNLVVRRDPRSAPPNAGAAARLALQDLRQGARHDVLEQFRSQLVQALTLHTSRVARPADVYAYLPTARAPANREEFLLPPAKTMRTAMGSHGTTTDPGPERPPTAARALPAAERMALENADTDTDEGLLAVDFCYMAVATNDTPDDDWEAAPSIDDSTPATFWEAMKLPDAAQWLEACKAEWSTLMSMSCFQLVQEPPPKDAMTTRWLFKRKRLPDGQLKYKARLVLLGHRQREGIDYTETYAPTVNADSMRLVLALANEQYMVVHHADATSAYIHADLDIPQHVKAPTGIECDGLWHLIAIRGIYGTHQGAMLWFRHGSSVIISIGFQPTLSDPCVFTRMTNTGLQIITLYVDDFLVCANTTEEVKDIIAQLQVYLVLNDLGPVKSILGMEVKQDRAQGTTAITQAKYIQDMAKKFGLQDAYPVDTPIPTGTDLSSKDTAPLSETVKYQSIVGSLLYCACMTRPDIAHAVSQLSRYVKCPRQLHMNMAKRVIKYLLGTSNVGLFYSAGTTAQDQLTCFTDSSWCDDVETGCSSCGYVWMLGGAPISWKSKLQKLVTLSTTEAEYVAACIAAQQGCHLVNLLSEVQHDQVPAPLMLMDNQSAIHVAKNTGSMQRTKHMALRFHFLRDLVSLQQLTLKYCPTGRMAADIMTKHVPATILKTALEIMGMGGCCG